MKTRSAIHKKIVFPKTRGYICLTAHPEGCKHNVKSQINEVLRTKLTSKIKNVLVIGSSTGYGLSSAITSLLVMTQMYLESALKNQQAETALQLQDTITLLHFINLQNLQVKILEQ